MHYYYVVNYWLKMFYLYGTIPMYEILKPRIGFVMNPIAIKPLILYPEAI